MKKLLFAFFVLTVVLGSISLQAQDRFSFADDDEREIPLDPVGSKEGGPIARSIIIQPASAYVDSDIVTVVFNKTECRMACFQLGNERAVQLLQILGLKLVNYVLYMKCI